MKIIVTCSLLFVLLPIMAFSQTKQQAEIAFLEELNILFADTTAESQGMGFPDKKIIEAPFTINKEGVLTVTLKRINADATVEISRMEAPINKIKQVVYDLYLILEFKDEDVTWLKFAPNSTTIADTSSGKYFHIGIPLPEDERHQIKLQKMVDELLKFYKN